mmetsp:Transcript_10929/g.17804  ORF Transcript_10929/g.17804 Transcript_10929/m.17804 type:complete len:459 (+) Transcript_10929:82-1458(+)
MLRRILDASASEKVKKALLAVGVGTMAVGVYQGWKIRDAYNVSDKLPAPTGPMFGTELWAAKIQTVKDGSSQKLEEWTAKIRSTKDVILEKISADDHLVGRGINKVREVLEETKDILKNKTEDDVTTRNGAVVSVDSSAPKLGTNFLTRRRKKIRLLVLGDSLVSGVGNDDTSSSPVLPQMIAKVLSIGLQADVEWHASGLVGATVRELRSTIVPELRRNIEAEVVTTVYPINKVLVPAEGLKPSQNIANVASAGAAATRKGLGTIDTIMTTASTSRPEHSCKSRNLDGGRGAHSGDELVVVVICGLNDWKEMLINFPFGAGPLTFKEQLQSLIGDLQELGDALNCQCRIYLPGLPLAALQSDPNFSLKAKPLSYLVDFFSSVWDNQKQAVALEQNTVNSSSGSSDDGAIGRSQQTSNSSTGKSVMYIGSPDFASPFATPGEGNVSSDGVHPSSQGCK